MKKDKVSKQEMKVIIDESLFCTSSLKKQLGEYPTNAIIRLIDARIKLATSTVDYSKLESVLSPKPVPITGGTKQ